MSLRLRKNKIDKQKGKRRRRRREEVKNNEK